MADIGGFEQFRSDFFRIFTQRTFRGTDFLTYLSRDSTKRSGDEASIVDAAIVMPVLELLDFAPAERVYNLRHESGRPDFAPATPEYGTCFLIEDKNTASDLTLDLHDPSSYLSQLRGYLKATSSRLGWLTNARHLTVWRFDDYDHPAQVVDLDIPEAIGLWTVSEADFVSTPADRALRDLFDLFHKEAFTSTERLERELASGPEDWQRQAIPLGADATNESVLVDAIQGLLLELKNDAGRTLAGHLGRHDDYSHKARRRNDDGPVISAEHLIEQRHKVLSALEQLQGSLGLNPEEQASIETLLASVEQDARAFVGPKAVHDAILAVINKAHQRKYANKAKPPQPLKSLEALDTVHKAVEGHTKASFMWHQRQAVLRQEYRADIEVVDYYVTWSSLVQETMLGDLDEAQKREEFALQAAYVVFIRLLLIRVCEDKGLLPRIISDGGLKHWHDEDIRRYLAFTNGNPYERLLDMAYANAQNIYAHFFTGRELFNWYRLDKRTCIMALHRLSRFDFAQVDSDIVGTIYNTYVSRKEKKKKGQYYTPPAIVDYILDEVGYTDAQHIIGTDKKLIDPACGSGTFLVSAARRLVAAYRGNQDQIKDPETVIQRVRESLFGFDLNPFACYLAEVNILIQVLDLVKSAHTAGKRPRLLRFHIYNVDALARSTEVYSYASFNTMLAEESDQVDLIKRRALGTPYATGFSFVVANPPYGATLSEAYKQSLREHWGDVFFGQPDTYVFFLKLGIELLAKNGKIGFITPNTYLMGVNTVALRHTLLNAGRIEQIVDLPQGIWQDVTVDCTLIFLAADTDAGARESQRIQVNMLHLRDPLEKLALREWHETQIQPQSSWLDDPKHQFDIRHDALVQRIEDACRVSVNGNGSIRVLRLGDVTESTQGIIPYKSRKDKFTSGYIKPFAEVPPGDSRWKPLLDGTAFVGRYELSWGPGKPYLLYGSWLWCPREPKYFDLPKLLVQDMRNRSLQRRLVATLEESGFYNRHNFSNIITKGEEYDIRYVLAVLNSSLLNYWFSRRFDNVHINPSYFRQLPFVPANKEQQRAIIALVDEILAKKSTLTALRDQDYQIGQRRDGSTTILVPYDHLLRTAQENDAGLATMNLYDAEAVGRFTIPARCDRAASVSDSVFVPAGHPTTVVLRRNKLWLEVPDDDQRRYLHGVLSRPRWRGKTWDEIKNRVSIPADGPALRRFFGLEAENIQHIRALLDEAADLDRQIDACVFDLYGITDPGERARILGSAPPMEEDAGAEQSDPAEAE